MRAFNFRVFFLFLAIGVFGPLAGCVTFFYPAISKNYNRTFQMHAAGGPYEKVVRACIKGRKDVATFARRCPVGSRCRAKENPGDLNQLIIGYDDLEATAYFKLGQLDQAYALAAKPEHEYRRPMRNLLGAIHLQRGELEKAAREYFYLLLLDDAEGAAALRSTLESGLARQPLSHRTPHILNLRAARCERSHDTQGALGQYSASISADPRQIHAYLQRARIYAAAGMPEKAMAELNTILVIDRSQKTYSDARMDELQMADVYFNRGRLRLEMSNADGAMTDFATAARRTKDPRQVARANFEIGLIHENMDHLDQAIASYKQACIPGFGEPWYRMAICYAQKRMPKESKEALVALAHIDREQSDALSQSLKELDLLD